MDLGGQRISGTRQLKATTDRATKLEPTGGHESNDVESRGGMGILEREQEESHKGGGIPQDLGHAKRPTRSQSISNNELQPPTSKAETPTFLGARRRTEDKISRSNHVKTALNPPMGARKAIPSPAVPSDAKVSVPSSTRVHAASEEKQYTGPDSTSDPDLLNSNRGQLREETDDRRISNDEQDKAYHEEFNALVKRVSVLETENQKLEQKLQEAALRCGDYVVKIRALQERAHKPIDSAEWMPNSANDTTLQFDKLASDIRKWSKAWVSRRKDNTPWDDLDAEKCTRDLQHLETVIDNVLPRRGMKRTVPLWLLLSAAISNIAFTSLIGDPFFAFRTGNSVGALSTPNASSLDDLIDAMRNSDEASAEAWRCQLIRHLDPVNSSSASARHNKEVARAARNKAAAGLASECTDHALRFMIKSARNKPREELTSIFVRGAELGWSLWAQKMKFEVLGLQSLQQLTQSDRLRFDSRSDYLQADRLNSVALDNHPDALDGVHIAMVVSPAVMAIGSADGNEYNLRRLWKKATVLIDD